MRKGVLLWLGLTVFVGACSYSGHLVPEPMNGSSPGSGYRSGYVPYRNDSKAQGRKDDALRKIAKYCGTDGYTVTREVPSAEEVQIMFRCGSGSAQSTPAPVAAPSSAQAASRSPEVSSSPATSAPSSSSWVPPTTK